MERKQIEVNYLYFGGFLLLLLFTSACSIFIKESLAGSRAFFFLYAAGQAVFETLILTFLAWIIRLYLGPLPLPRLLEAPSFSSSSISLISSWTGSSTFPFGKQSASSAMKAGTILSIFSMPLGSLFWIWAIGFGAFALIPFLGIALYAWTNRIASRYPSLRPEWMVQAFPLHPCRPIFWEFSPPACSIPIPTPRFSSRCPGNGPFSSLKSVQYPTAAHLIPPREEAEILAAIDTDATVLPKKPNVYLFVIESLREDFIEKKGSPIFSASNKRQSFRSSPLERQRIPPFLVFDFPLPVFLFLESSADKKLGDGKSPFEAFKKMGI